MRFPDLAWAKNTKIQNVNFKILLATKWKEWKLKHLLIPIICEITFEIHTIQNIFKRKKRVLGFKTQGQLGYALVWTSTFDDDVIAARLGCSAEQSAVAPAYRIFNVTGRFQEIPLSNYVIRRVTHFAEQRDWPVMTSPIRICIWRCRRPAFVSRVSTRLFS